MFTSVRSLPLCALLISGDLLHHSMCRKNHIFFGPMLDLLINPYTNLIHSVSIIRAIRAIRSSCTLNIYTFCLPPTMPLFICYYIFVHFVHYVFCALLGLCCLCLSCLRRPQTTFYCKVFSITYYFVVH